MVVNVICALPTVAAAEAPLKPPPSCTRDPDASRLRAGGATARGGQATAMEVKAEVKAAAVKVEPPPISASGFIGADECMDEDEVRRW